MTNTVIWQRIDWITFRMSESGFLVWGVGGLGPCEDGRLRREGRGCVVGDVFSLKGAVVVLVDERGGGFLS